MASNDGDPVAPFYADEDCSPSARHQEFYSISMHPNFQDMSVEELRLKDYRNGRHGPRPSSTTVATSSTHAAASSYNTATPNFLSAVSNASPFVRSSTSAARDNISFASSSITGASNNISAVSNDNPFTPFKPAVGSNTNPFALLKTAAVPNNVPYVPAVSPFAAGSSNVASNNTATRLLVVPALTPSGSLSRPVRSPLNGATYLTNETVNFLVGSSSPRKFTVHSSLIQPRSEFVRLALHGEWKEAQDRTITLPDDEPLVFSVYQKWLYNGSIHTYSKDATNAAQDEYELLVRAYILGEKLVDPVFKDTVIDAIIEKLRLEQRFNIRLASLVYENTPSASPLRRLWIDVYHRFGAAEWLDPDPAGGAINFEFMIQFSRYQMQNRPAHGAPFMSTALLNCTYHEHGLRPCHRMLQPMNWLS